MGGLVLMDLIIEGTKNFVLPMVSLELVAVPLALAGHTECKMGYRWVHPSPSCVSMV